MIKVMFVCHGNICRSPIAEFVLKDKVSRLNLSSHFLINSSATSTEEIGNDIYPYAKDILRANNIPFTSRKAVQFKISDYQDYDFIICMDSNNVANISRIVVDKQNKVKKLLYFVNENRDVSDPWYTGNFAKAFKDINEGIDGFLAYLEKSAII